MAILDKTVFVSLSSQNIRYYEKLGYDILKEKDAKGIMRVPRNTSLEVKVEDIPKNSHIKINISCDGCNKEDMVNYQSYNRNKHNDKYYCIKCSNKLYGSEKAIKTKLSKSKSFEQWCIENNHEDWLILWDYNLNNCSPDEVNAYTIVKKWFKCDKHKNHKSELKNIGAFTQRQEGSITCNQCNSFAQWGIDNLGEDFLDKYWSDKNTLNPWKISYGSKKKVWIKCQKKGYHEDYEIHCYHFIKDSRCFYCVNSHGKVHPKDSLGQYVVDNFGQEFLNKIWSDKNKKSAFEYSPTSNQKMWFKCLEGKHKDYKREISSSNRFNFNCPECTQERNESQLQEKVRLYLEQTSYTILHENKCTIVLINPKIKMPLLFDNEIKELKLVIEVHGEQHYKISGFHLTQSKKNNTTPEQELHYQKLKDRYKRIKAIQQGYYYLEIPYWTDDKEETWKQLIDNKLNEIKLEE